MASPEYAPGTVALVRNEWNVWNVAINVVGLGWQYGVAQSVAPPNAPVRPLVVLDPEDDYDVRAICEAYRSVDHSVGTIPMRDALRVLLNPKPEEPTGLGAVVEARDGRRWVRSKTITTVCHWKPAEGGTRRRWSDLPPTVRVLSEGVQ